MSVPPPASASGERFRRSATGEGSATGVATGWDSDAGETSAASTASGWGSAVFAATGWNSAAGDASPDGAVGARRRVGLRIPGCRHFDELRTSRPPPIRGSAP